MWIRRKVKKGHQIGRVLGHPTINLNVGNLSNHCKPGVYACEVQIKDKTYKGGLYFGPKLNSPGNILEIYIIDFSGRLYGQFIAFKLGKMLRKPKHFSSVDALQKQIQQDIASIV